MSREQQTDHPHQEGGSGDHVWLYLLFHPFLFAQGNLPVSSCPLESEYGRQSSRPLGSLEPGPEVVIAKAGVQIRSKEQIWEKIILKKAIGKERKVQNNHSKV